MRLLTAAILVLALPAGAAAQSSRSSRQRSRRFHPCRQSGSRCLRLLAADADWVAPVLDRTVTAEGHAAVARWSGREDATIADTIRDITIVRSRRSYIWCRYTAGVSRARAVSIEPSTLYSSPHPPVEERPVGTLRLELEGTEQGCKPTSMVILWGLLTSSIASSRWRRVHTGLKFAALDT